MMPPIRLATLIRLVVCLAIPFFPASTSLTQDPLPTATPLARPGSPEAQEPLRTVIEEIQLSVAATDSQGHVDPGLERDDILVLENGIPQEIRSARRLPASVLLLLDTGGETNSAKRVRVTREVAQRVIAALAPQDQIAVMQFNSKVELLQDWTADTKVVEQVLNTKLLSGKRAHFLDAIAAAADQFRERPAGNRNVVMITDGVQTLGDRVDRTEVVNQLMASNAAVYVISYTIVSQQATEHDRRLTRKRDKSIVPDAVIDSLPPEKIWDQLRRVHEPGGVTADQDADRRQQLKEYEDAMRRSEWRLTALSRETGGHIWLPESLEEMIKDGAEVGHLIDSQYVVSYKPKHPLASAPPGEVRRIDVASRRVGLNLISRRHYIVPKAFSNGSVGAERQRRVKS